MKSKMQNVLVGRRSRAETFLKANLEQRPGPWGELHKLKLPEGWRVTSTIAIENSDRFNDMVQRMFNYCEEFRPFRRPTSTSHVVLGESCIN